MFQNYNVLYPNNNLVYQQMPFQNPYYQMPNFQYPNLFNMQNQILSNQQQIPIQNYNNDIMYPMPYVQNENIQNKNRNIRKSLNKNKKNDNDFISNKGNKTFEEIEKNNKNTVNESKGKNKENKENNKINKNKKKEIEIKNDLNNSFNNKEKEIENENEKENKINEEEKNQSQDNIKNNINEEKEQIILSNENNKKVESNGSYNRIKFLRNLANENEEKRKKSPKYKKSKTIQEEEPEKKLGKVYTTLKPNIKPKKKQIQNISHPSTSDAKSIKIPLLNDFDKNEFLKNIKYEEKSIKKNIIQNENNELNENKEENDNSIDLQHLLQNNEEYNIKVNKIKDYINNMKKK